MEEIVKRVIWIDKNIKSQENQIFLEILEGGIKNAKFYPVESIKEAFDLIKNREEEITLKNGDKKKAKVFQFRLFYVIVSGSLSNDFCNEYIKATKEYTILSANIIFCNDEAKHRFNAYYLDDFLNTGKVFNEKSFDKIIDYINRDEATFLDESNLMESKQIYEPCKRSYGNIFFNASNISDIAYPFFFGQLINSTLINEYELEGFQKFLLNYYPELKDLIIPSREKKIAIPYYLLAKFYLHMYTYEKCLFFKNMNLDLTNDKFDIYRIYIFLLYDALNKKSIKSYSKKLYRGTVLSLKEFENLENILKAKEGLKKGKNKTEINACLYNCKMFLSFSKSEDIAKSFITFGIKDLIPVLFEVEGLDEKDMESNDFFISNLDLENISEFNEEEVLFLPFSCFEIVSIKDEELVIFEKVKIKRITLNYLSKYKTSLYKYIEGIKDEKKFENFLNKAINSSFSKEISQLLNFKEFDIGKNLTNFLNLSIFVCEVFQIGFKLLMYMPTIPGKIVAVGAVGLGIAIGFGIRKFKQKFIDAKEETSELSFFSESLYFQYIPKKFREYCIPILSWKGVSNKAKCFAIELVEDGYRKWLIINIKKWIRKIHNDNYFDVGETVCEYKGISKNPYKVTFILYELKEETKKEDWGEGKDIQEGYSVKLSKYFNQVATLDVF